MIYSVKLEAHMCSLLSHSQGVPCEKLDSLRNFGKALWLPSLHFIFCGACCVLVLEKTVRIQRIDPKTAWALTFNIVKRETGETEKNVSVEDKAGNGLVDYRLTIILMNSH